MPRLRRTHPRRDGTSAPARRLGAAAVALAGLACLGAAVRPSPSATQPAPTNAVLDSADCVRPLPLVKVMAVRPDGTQVAPHDGDGLGRAYYYGEPGDTAEQIVAPVGFSPLTASDQELAAYGFEPRPSDPALLPHWRSLYVNFHVTPPTGMCETNKWAGAAATA